MITLVEASRLFASWHELGPKKGRASKELILIACELLKDHSVHTVSDYINVSTKTLRNWQDKSEESLDTSATTFIPMAQLQTKEDNNAVKLSGPSLTVLLTNGIQVLIPKQPISETCQLLRALSEEFSKCSI